MPEGILAVIEQSYSHEDKQQKFKGGKRENQKNVVFVRGLNKKTEHTVRGGKKGAKMGEDKREGQRDGGVAASLQYFICQQVPEHHRTAESARPNGFTVYE